MPAPFSSRLVPFAFLACLLLIAVTASASRVDSSYGRIPIRFVENRGQAPATAAFHVDGSSASVRFTDRGLEFTLPEARTPRRCAGPVANARLLPAARRAPRTHEVALDLVGARRIAPVADGDAPTTVSFFEGSREQWIVGVPAWDRVVYNEPWPGIDLVISGGADELKYRFVVAPGADPAAIRLAWSGASALTVNASGALEVTTPAGPLVDGAPVAWQDVDGRRVPVEAGHAVRGMEQGFALGAYDPAHALVIDPSILVFGTYIGSSFDDRGLGIAVDGAGRAHVTGSVAGGDCFVARISAAGTAFDWISYIRGDGVEEGYDITVDAAGNAYVTGATSTSNGTYPATMGPDLTYNGGSSDILVAKLDPAGLLVYCGFLGGAGFEIGEGIAVDASGAAVLTGSTSSKEDTFPVTVGPDLTYNGGKWDNCVAKIVPVPSSGVVTNNLAWCGFIGGRGTDVPTFSGGWVSGGHVALDGFGRAHVSGATQSNESTFPDGDGFGSIPGADRTHGRGFDAFLVAVKADGTGLDFATYVGGSKHDYGFGMGIDAVGNSYMTGLTYSTEATLPVTVGPDLTYNGGGDAFVVKLTPAGTAFGYLGYVGGEEFDQGLGCTADASGSAIVIGHVHSDETTFPVVDGPDLTLNNAAGRHLGDAFLARVKALPSDPVPANNYDACGFIGGAEEDSAYWVAIDAAGNAYVVGDTDSSQATFPDGDGFGAVPGADKTHNGGVDAFVVKVSAP